ncbi:anti-sigma factor [Kineococcus sp. SYSU DK005]|uniref:anti-sigma factor n=1 Tax=Kineococcus sp. SYSU DK005 TaxID=3383126 RepID=UPI003D7CC13A
MLPPDAPTGPGGTGAHPEEDELVLLALGEPADPGAREHVPGCARCAGELQRWREVVATARSGPELPAAPVPRATWEAVARETGVRVDPGGAPRAPRPSAGAGDGPPGAPGVPAAAPAPVAPAVLPRSRRTGRWLALAAAFVLGGALGAGGTFWAVGDPPPAGTTAGPTAGTTAGPTTGPTTGAVLASTALLPLDPGGAGGAGGEATVARVDGHRRLDVGVHDVAPAGDGVLEVWLLDPDGGLLSLGALTGERLDVALPEAVDLSRFRVVDVSREPLDGDPGHSADSVLRGELRLGA